MIFSENRYPLSVQLAAMKTTNAAATQKTTDDANEHNDVDAGTHRPSPCNQTVMSGRTKNAIVDFVAFSLND
jgi:hypothetical protein